MDEKLENILKLVEEYISDKRKDSGWQRGDWVKYSGPNFDASEYKSAIKSLLSEWLILGKVARDFEDQFPKYLGKKHGVLTNSGSSANLLMVSTLSSKKINEKHRIPKGSKFITPVVCFPTTLNPLIQNGYEPVFVDVELPSLNLNLDEQIKMYMEKDSLNISQIEDYMRLIKLKDEMIKVVKPKWYENKWIWFTIGVVTTAGSIKLAGELVD